MILSIFRAINADVSIMATTSILFTNRISFMVAPGSMCLRIESLDMQEAPDVAKVDVQDMHATRNPIVSRARSRGDTLSLINFG